MMEMKEKFFCLKESETREALRTWWNSLENDRGGRARLRRAERPDDVVLTEPFFRFLRQMPGEWAEPAQLTASAMVAAALAHVKENQGGTSFAKKLASKKVGDKPMMSGLRFQQLQKSRDPDEFFRRLLRAIRLAENKMDILSLADSIMHWMQEYRFGVNRKPQERLAFRWANDYYTSS